MKLESTAINSSIQAYKGYLLVPYRVERTSPRSTANQEIIDVSFRVDFAPFSFDDGIDGCSPTSDHYRSLEGAIAVTKSWIDYNELNFAELL